jgi:hypothetical protein
MMNASEFSVLAALIFSIVSVLQLARARSRTPVTIGQQQIPMWASWIACFVAALLAVLGFMAAN